MNHDPVNSDYDNRLRVLSLAVVFIIAALILRLGYLQVYNGEYYSRLADGNRIRVIPYTAPRGLFYDCHGEILVTNRPGFTVSLLPLTAPIGEDVIDRLAKLLNVPVADIKERINESQGVDPIRIKSDVGFDIISIIEEQKDIFPGVIIEVQPIRNYLNRELAAHVFGYVGEISSEELETKKNDGYRSGDIIGKFGLERYYDKELRGQHGGRQVEVDVAGKPVQILGSRDAMPGHDIYLTIDRRIQAAAEKAVDYQLSHMTAKAAAVVVMDPNTGKILALVSRPAFDPNIFINGISQKDWQAIIDNPYFVMDNKAITGEYPPGSTFKIVTGTAALTEKVVTPEEKIFDSGRYWIDDKTNAGGEVLGWIDFAEAMAHSDNYYFYEMGYRLGIDRLEKYSRMFGLGAKTGINLPFEGEGLVASSDYKRRAFNDDWYVSETLDAAIGQGFNLVTPLQAAMIMSEIAADGKRFQPYVVERIVAADGKTVKEFKPALVSKLDVPDTVIKLLQNSLHDVTSYGTASWIFGTNFPISIAGKTGTAENPHGRDHAWFVAYGPFENPKVTISVIVEQGGYGATSAVPIGRMILDDIFNPPAPPKPATAKPQNPADAEKGEAAKAPGDAAKNISPAKVPAGNQMQPAAPNPANPPSPGQMPTPPERLAPEHLPKPHTAPKPKPRPKPIPNPPPNNKAKDKEPPQKPSP